MKTSHKENCKRAFKNYDKTCPRCRELIAGAEPREGWAIKPQPVRTSSPHPTTHEYQPNACGYCNVCGWGRDYS